MIRQWMTYHGIPHMGPRSYSWMRAWEDVCKTEEDGESQVPCKEGREIEQDGEVCLYFALEATEDATGT